MTFLWTTVQAQQPAAVAKPGFETASIRPSQGGLACYSMAPPGGTYFAATCFSLRNMIGWAYKTSYIDGGGVALDTDYDVRAATADGERWTMDTIRPLLQQLLAERFHLVAHAGKREISGYGMVIARGGSKLQSVGQETIVQGHKAGEPSQTFTFPGVAQGRGVDIGGVASLLTMGAGAPVVDHTGLVGMYNVDLRYAPENSKDSNLPSFFTAVQEQLGLKLNVGKVTVETLVIDHVDDVPTAN